MQVKLGKQMAPGVPQGSPLKWYAMQVKGDMQLAPLSGQRQSSPGAHSMREEEQEPPAVWRATQVGLASVVSQ